MRLKSAVFISALIKSEAGKGAFCTLLNKGAEEAGAIFICHNQGRANTHIYGPVSQSMLPVDHAHDRYFELLKKGVSDFEVSEFIEKQKRFDSDIWVLEIEKPQALDGLKIITD